MATYRPEWDVLSKKAPEPLFEEEEKIIGNHQGYKKSFAEIGRPSLKRTSLFASGISICEIDDASDVTSLDQGKGSTTEGSWKFAEITQEGLQGAQKTAMQKVKNCRRSKVVSSTTKSTSTQKRGRKKVSPLAKKATGKRTKKVDTVGLDSTGSVHDIPYKVTVDIAQPMKSQSDCTDSCGLATIIQAHEKQSNKNDIVTDPCLENSQSHQDSTQSVIPIKEEPSSNSGIDTSMSSGKPELKDGMVTEKGKEEVGQYVDGDGQKPKHVHSRCERARRLSQHHGLSSAAPLLARARKIKLQTKRRQSREQAEMEKEGNELSVENCIQSSDLDENEGEDNEEKNEGIDEKPQRKRGRKRKKVDNVEVNTKKRHVAVRRTSVIVKRDITELFALSSSFGPALPTIIIVSYSHYCRYKALQLRLAEYERLWCHPDVETMTGMKVSGSNTRLVFCRALFKNPNLLKLGVTMAMSVPSFVREERGRRKRRGSFDSSHSVSSVPIYYCISF
jgi:hypothetical protein